MTAKSLAVVTVVDDGGDARRAPRGVILAVFSQFLKAFGANNTVNFDAFGASQATMFSVLGGKKHAKTTVFTVFFGQHLAKTLVFAQFSSCCKT